MNQFERLPMFFERTVQSSRSYADPYRDVDVKVELTSPSGRVRVIDAFWEGGSTWRFRVTSTEVGEWRFRVFSPQAHDDFRHGGEGRFLIRPYAGPNPLYAHGPVRVSEDGTHFVHEDGTKFFWLADTAWNGALKARLSDWLHYLEVRQNQGFSVIQCVLTHWRAFPADMHGETALGREPEARINPAFFRRLDEKVAAIASKGLVPALVILWAASPFDPGHYLPESEAIRLARYIVARYDAYRPVWFLGGDGPYDRDVERWKRIGRATFDGDPDRKLVTLHPYGLCWTGDAFRDEPWFDFIGYQSSHKGTPETAAWLVSGPPAAGWNREPMKPVVNLEPCYEAHNARPRTRTWTPQEVRFALYTSLLVSPTAGVTYGHHGVWPWNEYAEEPIAHRGSGIAPPWYECLHSEGARSVSHLKAFFSSLPWWKLRPYPQGVDDPARDTDPERAATCAVADDRSFGVAYFPAGSRARLTCGAIWTAVTMRWFNPRTGEWSAPEGAAAGPIEPVDRENDWALLIKPEEAR